MGIFFLTLRGGGGEQVYLPSPVGVVTGPFWRFSETESALANLMASPKSL